MGSMTDSKSAARRPTARRLAPAAMLAPALLGLSLLTACDGDNLFTGNPPASSFGGPPVVASISAAPAIDEGGRLDVRVKAIAPAGMASIQIRYRRAVDEEQTYPTASRTDTVTVDAILQLPAEVKDSVLVIEVYATDLAGRVSEILSRTVQVIDRSAPSVSAVLTPNQAGMGDTVRIRVSARDNAGLRFVGFAIIDALGDTLPGSPQMIAVTGTLADTVFVAVLPRSLPPSHLQVVGIAVNHAQLRGVSAPLQLSVVDLLPPDVSILTPSTGDSYPLSDSILVRVHAADSGGIAELRLRGEAIRRDSLQNTAVVVRYAEKVVPLPGLPTEQAPRDTTIVRFLLPVGDNVSEHVYIIAQAKDLAGNVSVDTVRIMDGPRVQILNPAEGATVGVDRTLLVQIQALDRAAGLDSLKLVIGGVQTGIITLRNLFPLEALDTTVAFTIGSTQGILTLQPMVWNRSGAGGAGQMVRLTVGPADAMDVQPPQVSRRLLTLDRLELSDTIRVMVRATDGAGSGIARMGFVAVVTPDTDLLPRREVARSSAVFTPSLSGTPERGFTFTLGDLYSELESTYPRKFTLQVHAFAVDAAGNCGAGVTEQLAVAACDTIVRNDVVGFTARNASPAALQVTATVGRSVRLPGGGRIADALVDATRRRVYLSNIENNKVDIFMIGPDSFAITNSQTRRGLVGAAPWGLVMGRTNDSLYVANSGGTNISVLPLDGQNFMIEDVGRRILTPNVVLLEVGIELANGILRYSQQVHGFSDRPQFIAQHSSGTMLYSTLPTGAAKSGTLRYVDMNVGPRPEVYLLHRGAVKDADNSIAIAHLDSLKIFRAVDEPDLVVLYDRVPGTSTLVMSDMLPLHLALEDIADKGSDVEWFSGGWDIGTIGLSDTTFVASSLDRNTIAFGEGAKGPYGRIFLCCTITPGPPMMLGLTDEVAVNDLVFNAAERVFGVGLNANGTLGVARGSNAAYFFDSALRLQGEFRSGMANGGGGATLHPGHSAALETGDQALAFVPTSQRTIKIIDSAHFFQRGEIHIRDNVVGPVRTFMPLLQENAGRTELDPDYIVVKLIAVTQGSNVVIVDVRRKDIMN
jgi:hypothetical protein